MTLWWTTTTKIRILIINITDSAFFRFHRPSASSNLLLLLLQLWQVEWVQGPPWAWIRHRLLGVVMVLLVVPCYRRPRFILLPFHWLLPPVEWDERTKLTCKQDTLRMRITFVAQPGFVLITGFIICRISLFRFFLFACIYFFILLSTSAVLLVLQHFLILPSLLSCCC